MCILDIIQYLIILILNTRPNGPIRTLIGRVYLVTIILYKKSIELFWYCDGKLVVTVNRLTYKIGVSLFYSG